MGIRVLLRQDPHFPLCLKQIPQPPQQIYYLGNIEVLHNTRRLAVVGSRKVSPYGQQVTTQLVRELVKRDIVVVSGLALGVDSIAHQAALEGGGQTIAFLAGGLGKITPASNFHIAQSIINQGGLLLSEYSPEILPRKHAFIARNRLVAGISNGILITEAAAKSGTMHTAGFALDQGTAVMAVPGNITSTLSEGTNNLIKSGAIPVTRIDDILLALDLDPSEVPPPKVKGANPQETVLLELLQAGTTATSDLLQASKFDVPLFNQTLTMLEITDKIYSLGGGHWALK